jgi:hypothetical protein
MKERYIPGEGCLCHAHSEAECGCDADWTPREVYELREQRDRLAEAMRAMWPFIEEDPPCGGKSEIQQYLQALAAVKGGSDE